MAFVETVDTDHTDNIQGQIDQANQPANDAHITLPDWDNAVAVGTFLHDIEILPNDLRGVKTLRRYVGKYLDAVHLAERHMIQIKTSVNTINGVPGERTGKPDEKRKFKRASQRYFSTLNTPGLRKQCELFGIDYDSYEDQETIIAELVKRNVEMRNS
jgi:hypothetical protein